MIKIANNLQRLVKSSEASHLPIRLGLMGGAAGGLGGVGIGALIEYLRNKKEKNYLKAMLLGGGIGAGALGAAGAGIGSVVSAIETDLNQLM